MNNKRGLDLTYTYYFRKKKINMGLFLACTVTQQKIKLKTIWWMKSRNCDIIEDN